MSKSMVSDTLHQTTHSKPQCSQKWPSYNVLDRNIVQFKKKTTVCSPFTFYNYNNYSQHSSCKNTGSVRFPKLRVFIFYKICPVTAVIINIITNNNTFLSIKKFILSSIISFPCISFHIPPKSFSTKIFLKDGSRFSRAWRECTQRLKVKWTIYSTRKALSRFRIKI